MNKIKIYDREIEDGVSESVKSQASIAYYSPVCTSKDIDKTDLDFVSKIEAENKDQIDLYYLESVLVSTNWNKNDDVFLPSVTWAARNTPEDKQFNFMHDENDIIGHITGSYVIDRKGNKVAGDVDTPPSDFDIITRAVLYNSWSNQENRDRMIKIIAEMDEGKWFVSMECLFAGFDYSVIDQIGNQKLISRNEESAFLTKHLRSYGGTGEYEGYKVGRALRNISFSGKGLVSNPANPRSVILNSKSIAFSVDTPQLIGETDMSDSKVLEGQLVEVKNQLAVSNTEIETLRTEAKEAKERASKVEGLEAQLSEKDTQITAMQETIDLSNTKIDELTETLTQAEKDNKNFKEELEKKKKEAKDGKRKAALVEAGLDSDEVEANLVSFDALDDEAFEAIVSLYVSKTPVVTVDATEDTTATEEITEDEAEEVTSEIFEDVESDDLTLVEASDESVETARAQISEWISKDVLNTK